MTIGVITPTYLRMKFLQRFLWMMARQSCHNWRLVVVHDGPNPAVEAFVGQVRARDPRIGYAHTSRRSNNYGVSARLEGLRYMIREIGPDYCVFWDDDNYFSKHALRRIIDAIEDASHPDLLLMPMRYDANILPHPGASAHELTWGKVDTGCFVVRPEVGVESYTHMLSNNPDKDPMFYYTQDARFFLHIRDEMPGMTIGMASCRPIGVHDGLRIPVYIRSLFGLPPLGIVPRILRRDVRS